MSALTSAAAQSVIIAPMSADVQPRLEKQADCRWSQAAAIAIGLFALTLGFRTINSEDLGYHLAYGQQFWQHGHVVDSAMFVHPGPLADDPQPDDRPPGSWIDAQGAYRFVNANWLSQVMLWATWQTTGWPGLSLLRLALLSIVLVMQALLLRRAGVNWVGVAVSWLATALVMDERLQLRPELFTYAIMATELWLITGPLTRRRLASTALLQLLLVNVHSYWPLGIAMIGCFAAGAGLRWLVFGRDDGDARHRCLALGGLTTVAGALAIAHPAGWRNVMMPIESLAYLDQHEIIGRQTLRVSDLFGGTHPWATIAEFRATTKHLGVASAPTAFVGLTALAGLAIIVQLLRRQWGWALAAALFIYVGFGMRRNIAVSALVLGPVVATALVGGRTWLAAVLGRRSGAMLSGGLLIAIALVGISAIVSQRWYTQQHAIRRFGFGPNQTRLHLDVGQWMESNLARPRPVFTTIDNSSSALLASSKVSALPLLTNTWAQLPQRIYTVYHAGLEAARGEALLDDWNYDLALLIWRREVTRGLIVRLSQSDQWSVVWIGPRAVLFARTSKLAELGAEGPLRAMNERDIAVEQLLEQARAADPVGRTGLTSLARILEALHWFEPAVAAWRVVYEGRKDSIEAHDRLSYCLVQLARRYRREGRDDWQALFDEALRLDEARKKLSAKPDPFQ